MMSVLWSNYESSVTITDVSQSLPMSWRENRWHRFGMKKLRHCNRMYIRLHSFASDDLHKGCIQRDEATSPPALPSYVSFKRF